MFINHKGRVLQVLGGIAAVLVCLGVLVQGCGQQKKRPEQAAALPGVVCPPDASYCPVQGEEQAGMPPAGAYGRLLEPVRAKVLVFDEKQSDPRAIDAVDIPAGTWLTEGGTDV